MVIISKACWDVGISSTYRVRSFLEGLKKSSTTVKCLRCLCGWLCSNAPTPKESAWLRKGILEHRIRMQYVRTLNCELVYRHGSVQTREKISSCKNCTRERRSISYLTQILFIYSSRTRFPSSKVSLAPTKDLKASDTNAIHQKNSEIRGFVYRHGSVQTREKISSCKNCTREGRSISYLTQISFMYFFQDERSWFQKSQLGSDKGSQSTRYECNKSD